MTSEIHIVSCPSCKGPSRFAPDNIYRPFCSVRCKGLDFGAWASEQFRVPTSAGPDLPNQDEPIDLDRH